VRDAHVARLRVNKAAERSPVDDQPGADAGPDGQVAEIWHLTTGSPTLLSERRGRNIGVERHGDIEPVAHHGGDRGPLPSRLGRRRDFAPGWGFGIGVDRAERADAHRGGLRVRAEEGDDPVERLGWAGGGELLVFADVVGSGAECADAPGASCLDPAVEPAHRPIIAE
jgi:hypothetical protein